MVEGTKPSCFVSFGQNNKNINPKGWIENERVERYVEAHL